MDQDLSKLSLDTRPVSQSVEETYQAGQKQPVRSSDKRWRDEKKLGHYRLLEKVGEGACGTLYKAIDERLDRLVAVKVLHDLYASSQTARQRILAEAKAAAAIRHPHIVTVYDVSDGSESNPYLVMEFIEGQTLREYLSNQKHVSPRRAAKWTLQIAAAVAAAHKQNLIHRDIKTSNILLDGKLAKLSDFGLAREENDDVELTPENVIAGTPAYMSPEQIAETENVGPLSDVYSLGVVLYELLTGQVPFQGPIRNVLKRVLHEAPVPPHQLNPSVPEALESICLKAMEKDPQDRFSSAFQFATALRDWVDSGTQSAGNATVPGASHSSSSQVSTVPWLWIAVGGTTVVTFLLLTLGMIWFSQTKPEEEVAHHEPVSSSKHNSEDTTKLLQPPSTLSQQKQVDNHRSAPRLAPAPLVNKDAKPQDFVSEKQLTKELSSEMNSQVTRSQSAQANPVVEPRSPLFESATRIRQKQVLPPFDHVAFSKAENLLEKAEQALDREKYQLAGKFAAQAWRLSEKPSMLGQDKRWMTVGCDSLYFQFESVMSAENYSKARDLAKLRVQLTRRWLESESQNREVIVEAKEAWYDWGTAFSFLENYKKADECFTTTLGLYEKHPARSIEEQIAFGDLLSSVADTKWELGAEREAIGYVKSLRSLIKQLRKDPRMKPEYDFESWAKTQLDFVESIQQP